jgi:hypothetical protein
MRVETSNGLQDVRKFEASRVVVSDNFGNPIAVCVQLGDNVCWVACHDNPKEFAKLCELAGVGTTTVFQVTPPTTS